MDPKDVYENTVVGLVAAHKLTAHYFRTWDQLPACEREAVAAQCETGMSALVEGRTYSMYAHATEANGQFWLGIRRHPPGDYEAQFEGDPVYNFNREDDDETYPTPALAFARGIVIIYERLLPLEG